MNMDRSDGWIKVSLMNMDQSYGWIMVSSINLDNLNAWIKVNFNIIIRVGITFWFAIEN